MDDDFNTAGAMGAVFGFVTECNQYLEQVGDAADKAAALAAADTLVELLDTFGVELPEPKVELPLGLLGVAAGWLPTLVTTWTRQLPRFSRPAPRPAPPRTGIWPMPSATSSRTWACRSRILPRALVLRLSSICRPFEVRQIALKEEGIDLVVMPDD